MTRDYIEGIRLFNYFCSEIHGGVIDGAKELIDLLRKSGANILKLTGPQGQRRCERLLAGSFPKTNKDGDFIIPEHLKHGILQKEPFPLHQKYSNQGVASFGYIQSARNLSVGQAVRIDEPEKLNGIAHGLLSYAELLYPLLHPKYAWIDESGENCLGPKRIAAIDLKYIFWANFFGPEYVVKYGRKFFLEAPGWKVRELDDGGILYVTNQNYLDWWEAPSQNVQKYFANKVPDVNLYQSKGVQLPEEISRMILTDTKTGAKTVVYQKSSNLSKKKKK